MKIPLALLSALLISVLSLPFAAALRAQPANGGSFFLGATTLEVTDAVDGSQISHGSFVGGLGYQYAMGRSFSLNANISEVGGDATMASLPTVTWAKYDTIALGARLWFGSWFVGLHHSTTTAVFSGTAISLVASGSTSGSGFDLGWEGKGPWFVAFQRDSDASLAVSDGGPTANIGGSHLKIGYRWK
ncbi:MAG: hypothetical protein V3S29_06020 [bacterium]